MKKLPLLIAFLSVTARLPAQKSGQALIDSLGQSLGSQTEDSNRVKTLGEIARVYYNLNPKKSFSYIGQGLRLAEKLNWKRGLAKLGNDYAMYVGDTGNNVLARAWLDKTYRLNRELGDASEMIVNLNNIGRTWSDESDFPRASDAFFKAMSLAEKNHSPKAIAMVGGNLTYLFYAHGDKVKAREYNELTIRNAELAHEDGAMMTALAQRGEMELNDRDSAEARIYLTRALKVCGETGNKSMKAQIISDLATLEWPDFRKMLARMEEAQKLLDLINPNSMLAMYNLAVIGDKYTECAELVTPGEKKGYLGAAAKYLHTAYGIASRNGYTEYIADVDHKLSALEAKKGNFKTALVYSRNARHIEDSLFSQEKKNDIAAVERKHQEAIKDNEIDINRLQLANQRKTKWALAAGLLLPGTIGLLLFLQNRRRKKTNSVLMVLNNQLDEANKTKAMFFGILSHDLREPVLRLTQSLQDQKEISPGKPGTPEPRYDVAASARELLNTMEAMLLWSKEQMDNFKPEIRPVAVPALFEYIRTFDSGNTGIDFRFEQQSGLWLEGDENYLRAIMQHLSSSAITMLKDSSGGFILWEAARDQNFARLSITVSTGSVQDRPGALTDGGNFIAGTQNGFRFYLIRDLAKAIHCEIVAEPTAEGGTRINISGLRVSATKQYA